MASNPAIALRLQWWRPVGRVAEFGSLIWPPCMPHDQITKDPVGHRRSVHRPCWVLRAHAIAASRHQPVEREDVVRASGQSRDRRFVHVGVHPFGSSLFWHSSVSLVQIQETESMTTLWPNPALQRNRHGVMVCNGFVRACSLSPCGPSARDRFLSPFPKKLKCGVPSAGSLSLGR